MTRDESGFTLVELMVAITLFLIMSIGVYQVMFSTVRGSDSTQKVSVVSQNARLGLNRMIRDTREAVRVVSATDTAYRIWTDFATCPAGSSPCSATKGVVDAYEYMEYAYSGGQITLRPLTPPTGGDPSLFTGTEGTLSGESAAVLIDNVVQIGSAPVFSYASNYLRFDSDGNGEVTATELDSLGSTAGALDGPELSYVSTVNYAFGVQQSGRTTNFYGQAELRNRRYSNL